MNGTITEDDFKELSERTGLSIEELKERVQKSEDRARRNFEIATELEMLKARQEEIVKKMNDLGIKKVTSDDIEEMLGGLE